jgi:threonine/homoserine/homoserine lactone efflux protein
VGYAIRYRLRGSVGLCLGIAAGNGLYILLAIIGWGILRQAPLLFTVIELLGAAYLLWIGSLLLRSRPATLALHGASASRPPLVKQLFLGLGSSLLNPKNALFYLALMTSLLGPNVTLVQQAVSGLDDQRGVDMGSVAGHADCATVGAAPPFRRRLASRAHGRRRIDGFWLLDCVAVYF